MKRDCRWYKERLTDIAFDEGTMDDDTKAHLTACLQCSTYFEQLSGVRQNLDKFYLDTHINLLQIQRAFVKADEIKEKAWSSKDGKKSGAGVSLKEVLLFILLALTVLVTPAVILARFNIRYLLYVQIIIYFSMPLVLLPLLKIRRYDI
ncbi:MAG TPA: hypothetical protein GXZ32_04120 [Clostridiales bacterium]|nr:hypothetical protein [Clostridiales bacterium]